MRYVLARVVPGVVACVSVLTCGSAHALAQGRGGADWFASGNDAHRSGWVKADPKISAPNLQTPGFTFMWKLKLRDAPLSQPVILDRYIGYRGFRSYVFIGDRANNVFTLDSDLARVEWQKRFPAQSPASGSATCPGGMTASVSERVSSAFATANAGRGFGGGRGGPAKSGVGMPGEGAITIAAVTAAPTGRGALPPAAIPGGPGRGRMPSYLTVLSSDGALHNVYISNGDEPDSPLRFLAQNANVSDVTIVDDVAYAATSGNCAGVPDGLWALDLASKTAASRKGAIVGTAFGPDSLVYATTVSGDLVALEAKSLIQKATYAAGRPFITWPVVFESGGRVLVAAATNDGAVHVVEGASLSKVATSAPAGNGGAVLATWKDAAGTPWILNGSTAMKLSGGGLQGEWVAHDIGSPISAAIVNGVAFLATAGSPMAHATLYALDAGSGKQLWSSGSTITSYIAPGGGLAAGGSAVYLGTNDGTFWAFGFPIEH